MNLDYRNDEGVTAIEYAILLFFISLATITSLQLVGINLEAVFCRVDMAFVGTDSCNKNASSANLDNGEGTQTSSSTPPETDNGSSNDTSSSTSASSSDSSNSDTSSSDSASDSEPDFSDIDTDGLTPSDNIGKVFTDDIDPALQTQMQQQQEYTSEAASDYQDYLDDQDKISSDQDKIDSDQQALNEATASDQEALDSASAC